MFLSAEVADSKIGIFAQREKMDALRTYQFENLPVFTDTLGTTVKSSDSSLVDSVATFSFEPFTGRSYFLSTRDKFDILDPKTYSATAEPARPRIIMPGYEKQSAQTDWLVIVLFTAIALFATIRYSYVKYMNHMFLSLINYNTSQRLLQENSYAASHGVYRLDAIFYLSFSIFIYQALNLLGLAGAFKGFLFFLLVLAAVLIYFFGKRFLYLMVGSLFETRPETGEFLFNVDTFNRALGIILLPLVALVSFSPFNNAGFIVIAGLAIIVVFNIVLIQRGAIILLQKQFSIFYLFLYLCTLEFLPLLLIYKVVVVE